MLRKDRDTLSAIAEVFEAALEGTRDGDGSGDTDLRYSMVGEKALANDKEGVLKAPGLVWFVGKDGKNRVEISDASATINKKTFIKAKTAFQKINSGDYNVNISDMQITLKDIFFHPILFKLYPDLQNVPVVVTALEEGYRGSLEDRIYLSASLDSSRAKKTILHEVQHYIQNYEGFAKGGVKEIALKHVLLYAPNYADRTEFEKLNTREEREKFLEDALQKKHGVEIETVSEESYWALFGEIEARNTALRSSLSQKKINEYPAYNDGDVIMNWYTVEKYYNKLLDGDFLAVEKYEEENKNAYRQKIPTDSSDTGQRNRKKDYSGRPRTSPQVHGGSKENGLGVNYEETDASGGRTRERRRTKQGSGSGNTSFESDLGLHFSFRDSDGNTLTPQQQAKYTSNTNPTKDFDIRFSMKDTTPADLTAVQEENESLNSALRLTEEFTKLAA